MKKITSLLILLILVSCSQEKYSELNGNVESVKETIYEADEKFGEPIKGDLINVMTYIYDKNGNSIKLTIYDNEGDKFLESEYQYENDKQIKTISNKKKFDYSISRYIDIKEIEELIFNSESKNIWTVTTYDSGDKITDTIINLLDKNHFLKSSTYKRQDGTQSINYYNFDLKGRILESKWLQNGKDIQQWEKFEFENNLLIKKNILYLYGVEKTDVITYKYKIDEHSNWIEKIEYENGKVSGIIEREITYR